MALSLSTMNPFDRQVIYLRHPNGGVEDIDKMYAAGFRTFLLTMHDSITLSNGTTYPRYSYEPWKIIIERISIYPDAVWLPWAYIWFDNEIPLIRQAGQQAYAAQTNKLSRPAACFNAEKQLDPHPISGNPGGATVHIPALIAGGRDMDILFSTTPWSFENVEYHLLPKHWILDCQLFPAENAISATGSRDCRARWYDVAKFPGKVYFMHGVHGCTPQDFPWPDPQRFSIYAADDCANNYSPWSVKPLAPLSEVKYPFKGPFYAETSKQYVTLQGGKQAKDPSIKWIKKALHNAGYGTFAANPDTLWNVKAQEALRKLQQDKGLPVSGNFGRGAWTAIRSLGSANPGKKYALEG